MKMKYRTLLEKLQEMTPEQLECDVTVEDPCEDECYGARLLIAGTHHSSLDENHPVLYMDN
jgi:hypothetical protein